MATTNPAAVEVHQRWLGRLFELGARAIKVDFGDRTAPAVTNTSRLNVRHRFDSGKATMKVTATDKAGNTTVVTYRVSGGRATLVRSKAPAPGATPAP